MSLSNLTKAQLEAENTTLRERVEDLQNELTDRSTQLGVAEEQLKLYAEREDEMDPRLPETYQTVEALAQQLAWTVSMVQPIVLYEGTRIATYKSVAETIMDESEDFLQSFSLGAFDYDKMMEGPSEVDLQTIFADMFGTPAKPQVVPSDAEVIDADASYVCACGDPDCEV
jgi:hypothetical protein